MSPAATSVGAAGASSESAVATVRSSSDALLGEQQLGDLDRVQRRALAQVVADDEERQPVLGRRVARGSGRRARRRRPPRRRASGTARAGSRARRRGSRSPARRESGSCVSSQTASAWPTSTGTRTQVALTGSAGSSRILRVSSRSFSSSSNSTPSKSQSMRRSFSSGDCAAQPLHRLRARARDRLVGRDAHAREPRRVVQRLERARERDRAAVRVRDDAVVLGRPVAVHLRHDERDARLEPVGGRLVDRRPRRRGRRAGRARGSPTCRRRRGRGRGRRRRAPRASPPRRPCRRAPCPPSARTRTGARRS